MSRTAVQDLVAELDNVNRSLNYIVTAIGGAPISSYSGYKAPGGAPPTTGFESKNDENLVRNEISCRRERERLFPKGLFSDPAWDIILDLFDFAERGKKASITSVCIAAAVPPTTALRWIKILEDKGLIYREADPHDRRRFWLYLPEQTKINVRHYLSLRRQQPA